MASIIDQGGTMKASLVGQTDAFHSASAEQAIIIDQSITVTDVQESSEDGGTNIITFSDGTSVSIKNGNKGSEYDDTEVKEDISELNESVESSSGQITTNTNDITELKEDFSP